ncbi:MAG: hypothetical protein LC799_14480, partial [Actinobacteria bacterium]|nr:hypothetical protein [Actinomycetota bacterium]
LALHHGAVTHSFCSGSRRAAWPRCTRADCGADRIPFRWSGGRPDGQGHSDGEPGPDQGSSLTNERNIVAKHAKKTTAQAIAWTGARTTASVAVAAAGLLALGGVANAHEDTTVVVEDEEETEAEDTVNGNGIAALNNVLNENNINVQANVCDVLNNLNVDVIEVLSDIDLDLLAETNGGDDAVVGDTGCSNESAQVGPSEQETEIESLEVDGDDDKKDKKY